MNKHDAGGSNGQDEEKVPLVNWKKLDEYMMRRMPANLDIHFVAEVAKNRLGIFSFEYMKQAPDRCVILDIRSWIGRYRRKIQPRDDTGYPIGDLLYQSVPVVTPDGVPVTGRMYKQKLSNVAEFNDRIAYWRYIVLHGIQQLSLNERAGLEHCGEDLFRSLPPDVWAQIHQLIDASRNEGGQEPNDCGGGPPRQE